MIKTDYLMMFQDFNTNVISQVEKVKYQTTKEFEETVTT